MIHAGSTRARVLAVGLRPWRAALLRVMTPGGAGAFLLRAAGFGLFKPATVNFEGGGAPPPSLAWLRVFWEGN